MGQVIPARMWTTLDHGPRLRCPNDPASPPCSTATDSGCPAVRIPDIDHRAQDVVPGLLLQHRSIGEHAAVPADVLVGAGRLAGLIAHPEASVGDDIEPSVRVVYRAVAAGL